MASKKSQYQIEGMTCGGCAARIASTLNRDPRVTSAVIDFATRTGVVEGAISEDEVAALVSSLGYNLMSSSARDESRPPADHSWMSPEFRRLIWAALLAIPVMIMAMGPWHFSWSSGIQATLATLFMIGPARGFFLRAFKQSLHGVLSMDTLVAVGIGSAWLVSLIMISNRDVHLYFESGVMIGFFVLLGKALEDWARRRSIGEIDRLFSLRPKIVWKLDSSGQPTSVAISDVAVGDQVYLRPGDMLALDGVIAEGEASFDESVITGESLPAVRTKGDYVPSGAVNAGATGATVTVTRVGKDTAVERILQLIEDARMSRPPIQKLADKIALYFVPIVMILAVITFGYWWLVANEDPTQAMMIGLSVLVVACPCALGLATPVAWVAGLGRLARAGVLVRSYEALETLRRANVVVFDKTGTVTEGRPKVVNVIYDQATDDPMIWGFLASGLAHSSHPLSRAVYQSVRHRTMNATIPLSRLVEERAGQGIVCEIKTEPKKLLKIGRPDFVTSRLPPQWDDAVSSNNQLVAVSIDEQPYFLFELSDALRDDALQAIEHLRGMKFEVYIASGDKESVVAELTRSLPKITAGFGLMTPQSKRDFVLFLQTKGKIIAFVGDGINDAPALATADVGIAMGSGTDVAAQTAGLVLQKSGLRTLTAAIDLSRKITRIIKENFFWAFFYNVAAIPLAMMGLVTPMWAALAMALSSVSVVLNALRLRY